MPKYYLNSLGSNEFENMCQSLIQVIIGNGAKIYGMGKDGAREATFDGKAPYPSVSEQWEGKWIFQAKFHDINQIGMDAARKAIVAEVDSELRKIVDKYEIQCDNYILCTNVSLSPAFRKGTKDVIDNEIIPKYKGKIKHIHVWGAEEICRFLDSHADIRLTYSNFLLVGDIIFDLVCSKKTEQNELVDVIKSYCLKKYSISEKYAMLDDAGDLEDKRIELNKVFIDLDIELDNQSVDNIYIESISREQNYLREHNVKNEKMSALSYLFDDSIKNIVVVGGPGQGKSTITQFVSQFYRAILLGKTEEFIKSIDEKDAIDEYTKCMPRIPLRIILKDYAQYCSSNTQCNGVLNYIINEIYKSVGMQLDITKLQRVFRNNPILLVLDGLDEVSNKELRTIVIDNVDVFIDEQRELFGTDLKVIATTRPHGYTGEFNPKRSLHIRLTKLSNEKCLKYANKWVKAKEYIEDESMLILERFNICIRDDIVSSLTYSPLQVTIILVIIRAKGILPKQREELFDTYMKVIYEREQKKNIDLIRTEKELIYGFHGYLAYIIHRKAQKGQTDASLNEDEFQTHMKKYIFFYEPLLNKEEISNKCKQIMKECKERLILIENFEDGKIGFSITSMREFLAAMHLVDTSKSTNERDVRFKALLQLTHWHHVALFFAGRVGRTRPGEISSLVDVCREIDSRGIDIYTKRGACLVVEMLNERVFLNDHNAIGAMSFSFSLLSSFYVNKAKELNYCYSNATDGFKRTIIRPKIQKMMGEVYYDEFTLKAYSDLYLAAFGVDEFFLEWLKSCAISCDLVAVKFAVQTAIANQIKEQWVCCAMDKLYGSYIYFRGDVLGILEYMYYPASKKAVDSFICLILRNLPSHRKKGISGFYDRICETYKHSYEKYYDCHSKCYIELLIYYLKLRDIYESYSEYNYKLKCINIVNPEILACIDDNRNGISICLDMLDPDCQVAYQFKALFEFLLDIESIEKYKNLLNVRSKNNKLYFIEDEICKLIGEMPEDDNTITEYHISMLNLIHRYRRDYGSYKKDLDYLSNLVLEMEIVNANNITFVELWLKSQSGQLAPNLSLSTVNEIEKWIFENDLSKGSLLIESLEDNEIDMETLSELLCIYSSNKDKAYYYVAMILFLRRESQDFSESIRKRIKNTFKHILDEYIEENINADDFELSLSLIISTNLLDEAELVELYKAVYKTENFSLFLPFDIPKEFVEYYVNIITSNRTKEAANMACYVLGEILGNIRHTYKMHLPLEEKIEEWVWESYIKNDECTFKDKQNGLSNFRIRWSKRLEELMAKIKDDGNTINYWDLIIERSGYFCKEDLIALEQFLICIIESQEKTLFSLKKSAHVRLINVAEQLQNEDFIESGLNLPLPSFEV